MRCCAIDLCVGSKTKDFSRARPHLQEGLCQTSELDEKNAKELKAGQKQSLKMAGASVMALCSEVGDRKPASGPKCYLCIWPGIAVSGQQCVMLVAKQATLQGPVTTRATLRVESGEARSTPMVQSNARIN